MCSPTHICRDDQRSVGSVVHDREAPAPARKLAGDRRVGDDEPFASGGEIDPLPVEPDVTGLATKSNPGWGTILSTLHHRGGSWAVVATVLPGRLDEQPANMGIPRFSDPAQESGLARGILQGHQANEGPDGLACQPVPIFNLDRQRQPGQCGDSPQASWASDHRGDGRVRGEVLDEGVEPVEASNGLGDSLAIGIERCSERPIPDSAVLPQPGVEFGRPRRTAIIDKPVAQEQV